MSFRVPLALVSFAFGPLVVGCASHPPPPPAATPVMGDPVGTATAQPGAMPPSVARARPAPPAPPAARSAAAILADAIKAIGGEAALNAHTTKRMKVEIVFQRMGITGAGEQLSTRSDKMLLTTDLPGIGTMREGSNGKLFWSDDPINGLRAITGAEGEQLRLAASWCPELHASELFKAIEVKNEAGPGGAPLECLVQTPQEGAPISNCYDAATHLQVLQKGTHATPQGDTPFLSVLKDWRDVGGIKMAYAVDTQEGPLTFTMRITEVKLDEPMDDKLFEIPSAASPAAGPAATPAKSGGAKGKAKVKAAPKKP
jgi:hypothetical protein